MALADRQGVPNGAGDIGLRPLGRVRQRVAERQVRGDRRRERAAGAMRVARLDARGREIRVKRSPSNSRSTTSSPLPWPPLMTTATGPSS